MADMFPNSVNISSGAFNMASGERLSIRVLNSDGSERVVLVDVSVPSGRSFSGSAGIAGNLL